MAKARNPRSSNPATQGEKRVELPPELLDRILSYQEQKAKNEMKMLQLQEKDLELNFKIANKSLDYQKEFLIRHDSQHRKTFGLYAAAGLICLVLVLGFIIYCFKEGQDDFANYFIQIVSGILLAALGYFAGNKNKKSKESDDKGIVDPEIVD